MTEDMEIGKGLEIWAALAERQPTAVEQRCWNHRMINVLDASPTKYHAEATTRMKAMPCADTQTACERLRDLVQPAVSGVGSQGCRALAPRQFQRRCRNLLALFCYHAATRTGQTDPILPHVGGVLLCCFFRGYVV
jgi:hypothetical protein